MELNSISTRENFRLVSDVKSDDGDTSMYKAVVMTQAMPMKSIGKLLMNGKMLFDGLVEPEYDFNQACDWQNPLMVKRIQQEKYIQ